MAPDQVGCPVNQRITTIQECKLAAGKAGLNYYGDYFVIDRPPGCYYFRSQVYFNKNLAAKPTSVTWYGLGGICKGRGRGNKCWISDNIVNTSIPLALNDLINHANIKSRKYIGRTWMLERF